MHAEHNDYIQMSLLLANSHTKWIQHRLKHAVCFLRLWGRNNLVKTQHKTSPRHRYPPSEMKVLRA